MYVCIVLMTRHWRRPARAQAARGKNTRTAASLPTCDVRTCSSSLNLNLPPAWCGVLQDTSSARKTALQEAAISKSISHANIGEPEPAMGAVTPPLTPRTAGLSRRQCANPDSPLAVCVACCSLRRLSSCRAGAVLLQ